MSNVEIVYDPTPMQPGEFRVAFAKRCESIAADFDRSATMLALDSIAWLGCGEWALALDCGVKSGECLTRAAQLRALAKENA